MLISRMPTTHTSLYYHVVFSTKHREATLLKDIRPRVHEYLGGIIRGLKGTPCMVGGTADHIHIAMGLTANHRLCDVMREVKADSSAWIKSTVGVRNFSWQVGYGAFTYGAPDKDAVARYVETQEEHHRTKTFQEEYIAMLKRGLVEYDENYLW